MSELDDDALASHYEDPTNRRISGRAAKRRRSRALLTNHVPIRFSPETMDRVRTAAHLDGMTVSSWIRWIVDQEIARRWPAHGATAVSIAGNAHVTLRNDEPPTRAPIPEQALAS